MRRLAIFLLLLFSIIHYGYSQHGSNAYRDLADSLYRNHHYQYAADYYEKALRKTKQPGYLMLQLGKSYDKITKPAIAEKWFRQASANKADFTDEDYYLFAESLIAQQKIAQADSLLERMLQKNPNSNLTRIALSDVRNFDKFYRDSSLYRVNKLTVNTNVAEFSPVFFKGGIVFASARVEGTLKKKYHWDNTNFLNLYFSKINDDKFSEPELLEKDLNTRHHDGPASFYNGFQSMILNRNQQMQVAGREDVYEHHPGLYDAKFNAGKSIWEVTPLPFNNALYSYSHPSITEDGRTLYFVSDMPGGHGGNDVYRVERINGDWGTPVNVGPTINTIEDEVFPFFTGSTLYFASTGHGGMGGLDIFVSKLSPNGFTPPENPGYPINSHADDFSLITDSLHRTGYYASARGGNDDIFSYRKNGEKINLLAHIYDGVSKSPLEGASIQVITNGGDDLHLIADDNGDFNFSVPADEAYIVIGTKDDLIGMVSDLADSSKRHDIPAYRDTARVTCIGLIKNDEGLAQSAAVIAISDETNGQKFNHPGDQSIITFRGERGHRYLVEVEHELGHQASHTLEIGENDHGTKRFTVLLSTRQDVIKMAGRVFKAEDNAPLSNATVEIITLSDQDQELLTDSAGHVDFDLELGTAYVVIATKDGLSGMHSGMAEIGTGKADIIHPVPAFGDKINSVLAMGLVTSSSGKPIAGYEATVVNKATGEKVSTQANKGILTFLVERNASYNINVGHVDYETSLQELHIPAQGPEVEKFAVVLRDNGKGLIKKGTGSTPFIALQGKPGTLLLMDTDEGAIKAYVDDGQTVYQMTEDDGQLYLETPAGTKLLGRGTLEALKRNPQTMLASKGMGNVTPLYLRNIYFEFDKFNVDAEDERRLVHLKRVLDRETGYNLSISGHADERGVENYNLNLSQKRAGSVGEFISEQGILKSRVIKKAFGESRPAVTCLGGHCTEEDHQLNRRAEFLLSNMQTGRKLISKADAKATSEEFNKILKSFGEKHLEGISFKINIGAYRKSQDLKFPQLSDLGKIESDNRAGITYYQLSEFLNLKDAEAARLEVINRGIKDASISIYQGGGKINLNTLSHLMASN
ncbi:MAG: OmpA family protein [Chryseolinea sp.]